MKVQIAAELDSLVNGVVILRIPDELAWSIFVEGRNTDTIEGYDMASLRQFIRLFPALSLTKLLKAYFLYIGAPLPKEDASEDGSESEEEPAVVNEEDPFDIILVRWKILRLFSALTEYLHRTLSQRCPIR